MWWDRGGGARIDRLDIMRTRERERERESPRRRRVDILLSFLLFDLTDMTRESPLEPRTTGLLLTTTP